MGLILKTCLYTGILYLLFISFGEDIIRYSTNQFRLTENAGSTAKNPTAMTSVPNLVHTMTIPIQRDGHYWIRTDINNNPVSFIVDTGASIVTLSHEDAKALNLYLNENDYNITVRTAAGMTSMAEVTIDVLSIGVIELYDVKALIAREGMLSVSLLGMNFLNRLERFEFKNSQLIIEQ